MKRWQSSVALIVACIAAQGCADSASDEALKLVQISPAKGTQGTVVTLSGAGFAQGMEVCFAQTCGAATVSSATSATAAAPAGTGTVEVCAKLGSESSCLSNAFRYEEATVGECDADGVKCNSEMTAVVTCKNKVETTQPCPNGCEQGRCKSSTPSDSSLPSVSGISPVSGKAATVVTVSGTNLSQTSKVCFGLTCVDPSASPEATRVTAAAPEGSGTVTVSIVIGEKKVTAGNFTYLTDSGDDTAVDWCQLTHVGASIEEGDALEAYAQVYKSGVTGANGSHDALEGEIGYIDASSQDAGDISKYRWVSAKRNALFSGEAAGNNDEYMADALVLSKGTYRIAYRFSVNKGAFLYCDATGSQDGFNVADAASVTVREKGAAPEKTVEWCQIVGPQALSSNVGADSENVYAQFFVSDCTNYASHCADLKAQIGFAPEAQAASGDVAEVFSWSDAKINTAYDGSGGVDHDEYMATVKTPNAGVYKVVYRASLDGKTWTYCDAENNSQFRAVEGLTWTVTNPDVPDAKKVGWCKIHYPTSINATAGDDAATVYGHVYVRGCTGMSQGETACGGLSGQLGIKKTGEESYAFSDAAFNKAARHNSGMGDNDEFMAQLPIPSEAGSYSYVYRFKYGTDEWTMCDAAGNVDANGDPVFDATKAGTLTVAEPEAKTVQWCKIVNQPASQTAQKGAESAGIYAQAYVPGCTNATTHCEGLKAQIGVGAKGADVSAMTWTDAQINASFAPTGDAQNNDEFEAKITSAEAGEYDVFYRMSFDGENWRYCDTAGGESFDKTKAYGLTVTDGAPASKIVEYCKLNTASATVLNGTSKSKTEISGEAYVAGCTEGEGACAGLKGYVGYGKAEDALDDYTFAEASHSDEHGNNDVFKAELNGASVALGEYKMVFAFSADGGATKTYCDADGSQPFDAAKAGSLVSKPRYETTDDFKCGLTDAQITGQVSTENEFHGEFYWKDKTTGGANMPYGLKEANVYYIAKDQAGTHKAEADLTQWTKVAAVLSGNSGPDGSNVNQKYVARAQLPAGTYAYVFVLDLLYDPSDNTEQPQHFFCYADWNEQEAKYGELTVN